MTWKSRCVRVPGLGLSHEHSVPKHRLHDPPGRAGGIAAAVHRHGIAGLPGTDARAAYHCGRRGSDSQSLHGRFCRSATGSGADVRPLRAPAGSAGRIVALRRGRLPVCARSLDRRADRPATDRGCLRGLRLGDGVRDCARCVRGSVGPAASVLRDDCPDRGPRGRARARQPGASSRRLALDLRFPRGGRSGAAGQRLLWTGGDAPTACGTLRHCRRLRPHGRAPPGLRLCADQRVGVWRAVRVYFRITDGADGLAWRVGRNLCSVVRHRLQRADDGGLGQQQGGQDRCNLEPGAGPGAGRQPGERYAPVRRPAARGRVAEPAAAVAGLACLLSRHLIAQRDARRVGADGRDRRTGLGRCRLFADGDGGIVQWPGGAAVSCAWPRRYGAGDDAFFGRRPARVADGATAGLGVSASGQGALFCAA